MEKETRKKIFDISLTEFTDYFKTINEPSYRVKQLWDGLYKELVDDANNITTISKSIRQTLANSFNFSSLSPIDTIYASDNNTTKYLFGLSDGLSIETVHMKYKNHRNTICVSSQVGCALNCAFCATGHMGFFRNLSSGEIIEQVLFIERDLRAHNERLSNIVVMGMGEPFANYNNTITALNRINDPLGFNFGARRITISTVGLVPKIIEFADGNYQYNLAISLHAANNVLRSKIVPINKKYPLEELIEACKYYVAKTNRRITFEWALINNVNDTLDSAKELVKLIKGLLCHVNLIVLNPTSKTNFYPSSNKAAENFKSVLENNKVPCSIRTPRGIDINAGCGQLASKKMSPGNHML